MKHFQILMEFKIILMEIWTILSTNKKFPDIFTSFIEPALVQSNIYFIDIFIILINLQSVQMKIFRIPMGILMIQNKFD